MKAIRRGAPVRWVVLMPGVLTVRRRRAPGVLLLPCTLPMLLSLKARGRGGRPLRLRFSLLTPLVASLPRLQPRALHRLPPGLFLCLLGGCAGGQLL